MGFLFVYAFWLVLLLRHSIQHVSIVYTHNIYFVMHWSMLLFVSIWSMFSHNILLLSSIYLVLFWGGMTHLST